MAEKSKGRILVVDDEPINLEILEEYLEDEGYEPVSAKSAKDALDILAEDKKQFEVILLDWMMPGMSGYELLCHLKSQPAFQKIPVIMQTARSEKKDIEAGISAGAYYYLTKPYSYHDLMPLVESAVRDFKAQNTVKLAIPESTDTKSTGDATLFFTLQTLEECQTVIAKISAWAPEAPDIVLGLNELIINAIEHGNLEISYEEKSHLNETGQWLTELNKRLLDEKYKSRVVTVKCSKSTETIQVLITDEGKGFDWQPYLEIAPERAFDTHGRGIAMAKMLSFPEIKYLGCGNQVEVTCKIPPCVD